MKTCLQEWSKIIVSKKPQTNIRFLKRHRFPKDLREQMFNQHHSVSINTPEIQAVGFFTPCCSCENKSINAFHRDLAS